MKRSVAFRADVALTEEGWVTTVKDREDREVLVTIPARSHEVAARFAKIWARDNAAEGRMEFNGAWEGS